MCDSCIEGEGNEATMWQIEPHTVAKHELLRYYLQSRLPPMARFRQELLILDGFAGPGRYIGGEPGSPLVAINSLVAHAQLANILDQCGSVLFWFIEQRPDRVDHLNFELASLHLPDAVRTRVQQGTFEEHFDAVTAEIETRARSNVPLLVFADPFGPSGIPMRLFAKLGATQGVEVLINFAFQPLRQWLISDEAKYATVDELFGTTQWREVLSLPNNQRERFLVDLYIRSLAERGFEGVAFRMINQLNQTQYYLIFGSHHTLGLRYFKNAAWHVAPDDGFSFSDLRNPNQTGFGEVMGEDLLIEELRTAVWEAYQGKIVARNVLFDSVDRHPVGLPRHMRAALQGLQSERSPRILSVTRANGSPTRHGDFPEGSEIQFADFEQTPLF